MYTFLQVFVVRPFVWLFYGARIQNRRRVPRTGAVILAANHQSIAETLILPSLLPRRVAFLAKAELFEGKAGPFSKLVAWFMTSIRMVRVDRAGGRDSLAALRYAVELLESGGAVAMFPEGTRSPDGRLYKGKTGIARLALATGAPVIPIGLINTRMRRTRIGLGWFWRPRAIVGSPMTFESYAGRSEDRDAVRYVTDQIMGAIQDITGQDYVDVYASSAKYGRLTPQEVDARARPRPGWAGRIPPTNAQVEGSLGPASPQESP